MVEGMKKKLGWRQLAPGDLLGPATSLDFETGDWRTQRPIWDGEKCKNCLFCWIYCPDSAIMVKEKKMVGIDYRYCKGCGICAAECRFEAIEMKNEGTVKNKMKES